MSDIVCKLLIIGAGPGGYVCAIRAGQLGIDTVIVEAKKPGGTCLNVGCIPSKALIHAADEFAKVSGFSVQNQLGIKTTKPTIDLGKTIAWKDAIVARLTNGVSGLMKKAGVNQITGTAKVIDGKTVDVQSGDGVVRIHAEYVVVATGSRPVELPDLPFGGRVISSTEALELQNVPKTLAIIGGGYIGLEIGTAMAKLGSKVTIIEAGPRILPQYSSELSKPIAKRLEQLGVKIHLNAMAKGLSASGKELQFVHDGKDIEMAVDKVLVTVGREPVLTGFGLENLQLDYQGRFIKIDQTCQTSMAGLYAIGDVTGEPMLAHRAMAQGELVAEIISGKKRVWDKQCIPAVCFTDPEVVSVGLTAEDAKTARIEIIKGKFPFQASGRAMTTEREDGAIHIIARERDHVILGIHAVGAGIAELASSFSIAIEMGARLEDLAQIVQAHPTRGEALQEAALVALGHGLHV